jgi:hypothetical protein
MLTLYAFVIVALGSSAMARDDQPYGESRLLEGNIDTRLAMSMWGRFMVLDVQPPGEPGEVPLVPKWNEVNYCDDFLKFSPSGYIMQMSVFRVERQIMQRVPRYMAKRMEKVYHAVPSQKWAEFLDNTYWGRVPDIVTPVSDLTIRKS